MKKPEAYRGEGPYAFVSYAHEDASRVFEEIHRINSMGFHAYYDEGIHPGHVWRDELASAIDNSGLLVFFITPRSINRQDCLRELNYALDVNKPLLAVYLEDTELPGGVRLSINDRQAIMAFELSDEEYSTRLNETLAEFLELDSGNEPAIGERSPSGADRSIAKYSMRAVVIAVLLVAVGLGVWKLPGLLSQPEVVPLETALKLLREATDFAEQDQYGLAFLRIREIGDRLAGDRDFERLKRDIIEPATPRTAQDGVRLYFRPLAVSLTTDWIDAGVTPVENLDAPKGVLELRLEKTGFQTGRFVVANPGPMLSNHESWTWPGDLPGLELIPLGQIPDDFVHIPKTSLPVIFQGTPQESYGSNPVELESFSIGKQEVTNRQYKEFVDAGGYREIAHWEGLKNDDSEQISLKTIQEVFVDITGRSAPSTWQLGTYPAGEGDYPLGGISWFEAMAYAKFMNMSLPTATHWARAAQAPLEAAYATVAVVARLGNYNSAEPEFANPKALGPWGTWDMAGNVREWVINPTTRGRLAMGGYWSDYVSNYFWAQSVKPWDRSAQNGIRLMLPGTSASQIADLSGPIKLLADLPMIEKQPLPDAEFRGMRLQFTRVEYSDIPAEREILKETEDYAAEEVILRYPSGDTLSLYIAMPKPLPEDLQSLGFTDVPVRLRPRAPTKSITY